MTIYIKKTNDQVEQLTPTQLIAHINSHGAVIGLCLTPEPAEQYLFDVKNNELRRYPVRMNTKTTMDRYSVFQNNEFETTTSTNERVPQVSREHFFTIDEIARIIDLEKKCPYLENSNLSCAQQDLLYSGVIVPNLGMSLYYFLNEYIFPLPNPEKVLHGAIAKNELQFSTDDAQGKSALESLRYNFLAPNRIVFFDQRLSPDAAHPPTVGDILDFYTHSIQTALQKLGHVTVPETELRVYSDRSRAAKLGDLSYHFTEDEIHNLQGLIDGSDGDIIFRFVTLLLSPGNQTPEEIQALINNPRHRDFQDHRITLYRAISDLTASIETDSMTKIRSYLSAYDNIDALIGREGWGAGFLPHLRNAQQALLSILSVSEIIANDQRISEEQRLEIFKKLGGEKRNGFHAGALITLYFTNTPVTDELFDKIVTHNEPLNFASALVILTKKNITLTQPLLGALKNNTFLQIVNSDSKGNLNLNYSCIDYENPYNSRQFQDSYTTKINLTQSTVNLLASLVAENRNLSMLSTQALIELQNAQIPITPSIMDTIFCGEDQDQRAGAIILLLKMNIHLTPFVLDKLVANKNITDIVNHLGSLGIRPSMYPLNTFNNTEREGVVFAFCVRNQYNQWKNLKFHRIFSSRFFDCSSIDLKISNESTQVIHALDSFIRGNKNALETIKSITPGSRLKEILAEFGLLKNDKLDVSKLMFCDDLDANAENTYTPERPT